MAVFSPSKMNFGRNLNFIFPALGWFLINVWLFPRACPGPLYCVFLGTPIFVLTKKNRGRF